MVFNEKNDKEGIIAAFIYDIIYSLPLTRKAIFEKGNFKMRFVSKEICADKKLIEHISKKYDIHETVATILISRGFTDTLDEFFSEGEIHDPYLLK